ncbi:MAG: RNA polymerase-binding protein DksA [Panacagrimonas sp.]
MAQSKGTKKAATKPKAAAGKPVAKKSSAKPAAGKTAKIAPAKPPAKAAATKGSAKAGVTRGFARSTIEKVVAAVRKAAPKKGAQKSEPGKNAPAKEAPRKSAAKNAHAAPVAKAVGKKAPAKKVTPVGTKAASARPAVGKASSSQIKAAPPAAPRRRAVAVSHRAQTGGVSVMTRPAEGASPPPFEKAKMKPPVASNFEAVAALTEEEIRKAPESAYMNESQLAFFQARLLGMRSEVLARELDVKERLHQREVFADPADRATAEEEHWLDLRLRERESLLLKKIDDALRRIRDREYGYCEKTGEPIGIARLLARPTATVCVDIKGQDERAESQFRDR